MKAKIVKPPVLSISMIVKNESKKLRRCLDSVKKIMDKIDCQLIITDTGSTDDTVAIAKEYAHIVNHFDWCDDYSAARNFGLELATGEWYAFIDADEWYSDELVDSIVKFFKGNTRNSYYNCNFLIRNYHDDSQTDFADFAVSRYFRLMPDTRFKNRVHESIVPYDPTYTFSGVCFHDGYAFKTVGDAFKQKYTNYNISIEKQLAEDDNNISLLISYMASVKDVAREEQIILKAISLLKPEYSIRFCNTVYYRAILYYFHCQRYDIAMKYIDEYKAVMAEHKHEIYIDGYQIMALVYAFAKEYQEAVKYADIYLKSFDDYFKSPQKFISVTIDTISKQSKETFLLDIVNKLSDYDMSIALKYYRQYSFDHGKFTSQLFDVMLIIYAKNYDKSVLFALLDTFASLATNACKELLQNKLSAFFLGNITNTSLFAQLDEYEQTIFVSAFCALHHAMNTGKLVSIDADTSELCASSAIAPYLAALMCAQQDITPILAQLSREEISAAADTLNYLGASLCPISLKALAFAQNATDIKALMFYISVLDASLKRIDGAQAESKQALTMAVISCMARFAQGYYSHELICNNIDLLPQAHRFALQVNNASNADNQSEYIKLLRDAIITSPLMKPLAETLLEAIEAQLESDPQPKTEFELLAQEVKQNAKAFIASGRLDDAAAVLAQLKALVPNDTEIDNLLLMCK